MIAFIRQRPWLWIVVGFTVLITAWIIFMTIAIRNQPEEVPLEYVSPKK